MAVAVVMAERNPSQQGIEHSSGRLMAGGLGGVIFGGILMGAMPSTEQPGSSRVWTPASSRATGVSIGGTF